MSTGTVSGHLAYTLNEWSSEKHQKQLDKIFSDPSIKVVYDIGANVGGVSKIMLEKYPQIEKIYCFEPDTDNIKYLQNVVLKRAVEKGVVVPFCRGIYYGEKTMKVCGMGHICEHMIHPNVGGYMLKSVGSVLAQERNDSGEAVFAGEYPDKVFQLEELENFNILPPDFIKIDVEGSELNIIEHSSLFKTAKYIWLEWHYRKINITEYLQKNMPYYSIISTDVDYLLMKN